MLFVCIDFEAQTSGSWSSFGLLAVSTTSTGYKTVLHCEVGHCEDDRSGASVDPDPVTSAFWKGYPEAHGYNRLLNGQCSRADAEQKIVDTVDRLRSDFPDFRLVGDNPTFDVKLLDQILTAHGRDPICFRQPLRTYRQPICTWSYRTARVHENLPVPKRVAVGAGLPRFLSAAGVPECGPKHTPLFDCAHTLLAFFMMLAPNETPAL